MLARNWRSWARLARFSYLESRDMISGAMEGQGERGKWQRGEREVAEGREGRARGEERVRGEGEVAEECSKW